MKKLISIFCLTFIVFAGYSQLNIETFEVKTLNPGNIYEDVNGNIWFHPRMYLGGNLTQYDGNTFKVFKKENNIIFNMQSQITEDKDNNLWLNGVGLTKYDGNNWTQWTAKEGLPTFLVSCTYIDKDGTVHVFNSRFFYGAEFGKIENNEYKKAEGYPLKGAVSCVFEDSKGNLWFGGWKDGVYKKTGNDWTNYSKDIGFQWVTAIGEDMQGNIWVYGLEGNHAVCKNGIWKTFKYGSGFFANQAATIFVIGILPGFIAGYVIEDKESLPEVIMNNDEVWVLVRKRGIVVHKDNEMIDMQKKFRKDLKSPKKIKDMIKDSEGNIWIVNSSGYIAKYDGTSWKVYDKKIPNNLNTIFQDSNGIFWLAGSKIIAKFKL